MKYLKRTLEDLMNIEIWICGFMIIIMVLVMTIEIIMRYIFNSSLIWVQEFAIGEFIWIVALCGNIALMLQNHITIKTYSQFISEKRKIYLRFIPDIIVFLAILYMLLNLPGSIYIQNRTRTSALPINISKGIYYSVPLFFSSIVMLITQLYYFYYHILAILGKSEQVDYELKWKRLEAGK